MPCSTDPVKLPKKGYPLRPCPSAAILAVSTPDKFRTAYVPGKPVRRCFESPVSSIPGVISGFSDTDYLTFPVPMDSSSSFTIEWFMDVSTEDQLIFEIPGILCGIFQGKFFIGNASDPLLGSTVYLGGWSHYAICCRSGTADLYLNGSKVSDGSGVSISSYFSTGNAIRIGGPDTVASSFNVLPSLKLTNFRITKGVALYGDTYVVPSLPLSGGDLLLLAKTAETVAVDSSGKGVLVTEVGSVTWLGTIS